MKKEYCGKCGSFHEIDSGMTCPNEVLFDPPVQQSEDILREILAEIKGIHEKINNIESEVIDIAKYR